MFEASDFQTAAEPFGLQARAQAGGIILSKDGTDVLRVQGQPGAASFVPLIGENAGRAGQPSDQNNLAQHAATSARDLAATLPAPAPV